MITLRTNIAEVMGRQVAVLEGIKDGAKEFMRVIAVNLLPVVHDRIHVDGLDSNGSPIGTYSAKYVKYGRKKFNRGSDTKKIFSLTRQMENDFSVIATDKGYGLGFKNSFNYDKSQWVEKQSGKTVYALTQGEKDLAIEVVTQSIRDALQ